MINREATIRWKGYDPDDLLARSGKRVWANCDKCGNGRWVSKDQYRDLCKSCSHIGLKKSPETRRRMGESKIGDNNPMKRDEVIEKRRLSMKPYWLDPTTRERMSASHQDQDYDAGEWTGFMDKRRPYVTPVVHCHQLNDWFEGCEAHHISKSVIIFIPKELHNHYTPHNIKTGLNMAEINMVALQYINGGL